MNIYKINLNLLVAFNMLMIERHVTKASQKLHITQSAMSNALNRLRELFHDELLIKTPTGMEPTVRALELIKPIQEIIDKTDAVFMQEKPFDSKKSNRCFTIGLSDYTSLVFLPFLQKHLAKYAPNITLKIKALNFLSDSKLLDASDIELAVGFFDDIAEKFYRQLLYKEVGVLAGCKNSKIMRVKLTQKKFYAANHIGIEYNELLVMDILDRYLIKNSLPKRKIILSVPHAITALLLLPHTEFLTFTGRKLAETYKKTLPINFQEPPFEFPSISIHQIWHSRYHNDAGHKWLRGLIFDYCQK